jgi:predicted lipoprotein with Yx(FWY)xxD motif
MTRSLAPAFALALLAGAAEAHVVVQPATAEPGSDTVLRFVVGHGCNGQPTTALRLELPPAISAAKPQPKPGWTLSAEPATGRSPGVATWRGELAPHQTDDFQIQAHLPSQPGPLAFVAVQTCGEVTVRWDQAVAAGAAKPEHPAPTLTLAAGSVPKPVASAAEKLPGDVKLADGGLADAAGKPLYTFDFDTMVGMSHCFEDCAAMWPPLEASAGAKPFGDWALIRREDGSVQWTYKTKPLYTYSKDAAGGTGAGESVPNWRRAR